MIRRAKDAMKSKKWLTVAEAGHQLGVSVVTAWRWAKAGKLGATVITSNGRDTYRFPANEIDSAVKRMQEGLPAVV